MQELTDSIVSSMPDTEVFELEKARIAENPLALIEGGFLSIKTKSGDLIKFVPNKAQRYVLAIIRELQSEGKLIRLWILKARQLGISTLIEAIVYVFTSQNSNINSLIMADEGEHSNNLFEMSKLYHERLTIDEPHLAPELKKSNEKKLEFAKIHSQTIIATADNLEAARSHTYHIAHLSETAYFRNLKGVMKALNSSVPKLLLTMIFGETTANGMEDFHEEWERAIDGKTDWTPVFIPWFWMDEYSMPLVNGEMYHMDHPAISLPAFEAQEIILKAKHDLTDEQLNWRRYVIINDLSGNILAFKQEHPSCWEEAFAVTGDHFFDIDALESFQLLDPITKGEIFPENLKYEFRDIPHGRIELFEKPWPGQVYYITVDTSKGVNKDEAAIYVGNVRLNQDAAIVVGDIESDDLAEIAIALGHYFNNALIICENNSYGFMTAKTIFNSYGNVYFRGDSKTGTVKETRDIGFNTNSRTRPEMLGRMSEEIRLRSTVMKSKKLNYECKTFIVNAENGKAEAQKGKQDGLVICRAIFSQVRWERPYKPSGTQTSTSAHLAHDLKKQKSAGVSFDA